MILRQILQRGLANFGAARDNNEVIDQYLRGYDGLPMNISGFVIPFNATIVAISANRDGTGNAWTAEVRKNPSVTSIASISLSTSESNKFDDTLNVNVDAGDILAIYSDGFKIKKPRVDVFFVRR